MRRIAALGACALLIGACVQKPTRVSESKAKPFEALVGKTRQTLKVTDETVVLDARGDFDFGLNHVARAVPFTWDKLAQSRDDGEFIRDLHRAGERMALVGIRPDTPVVVVGKGADGAGEEGRLAWALVSLGVRDVQVSGNESLRKLWSPESAIAPKNAAPWEPTRMTDLELPASEFKTLASSLADLQSKRIWLIDVRSPKEYLMKSSVPGSINVAWTEFYTRDGRPNARIRTKLKAVDIRPDDRIVLLSPRGVRAASAAYALLALDFPNVQILRM